MKNFKLIIEDKLGFKKEVEPKHIPNIDDTLVFEGKQGSVEYRTFFYGEVGHLDLIVITIK